MKAARFSRFGGPEVLEIVDLPDPHPGPGQVRIAVRAAGVNPSDWKKRQGLMDGELPQTLAHEAARVVDELGAAGYAPEHLDGPPVDGDPARHVVVTFEPAAGERAERHDGQALARRTVDRRGDKPAPYTVVFEFLGNLGVDQGQPVAVAVVDEFGQVPADPDLETGLGLVVGNRIFIAHAGHRPIRAGRAVRRAALSRPGRRLWRRDAR